MTKLAKNNDLIGVLSAISCEIIFGFSYMFTKTATEMASEFALLGWRFFLAFIAISLCKVFGLIKINLKGKSIKPLLLIAICSPCLYFIAETIGIANTTASESGVFLACIPVGSLIASTLFLKEKPSKLQVFGITITLVGVLVTFLAVSLESSWSLFGYTFLLLAVISYSLYSVFVNKANNYTSVEITYVMLIFGAIVFGLLAVLESVFNKNFYNLMQLPFKDFNFLIAILYQGIACSVLAYFLSNLAISKIGVNRTSSFIGISTVVAIFSGAILLKESFSLYQFIGAVIIIMGIYTANIKNKIASIEA